MTIRSACLITYLLGANIGLWAGWIGRPWLGLVATLAGAVIVYCWEKEMAE